MAGAGHGAACSRIGAGHIAARRGAAGSQRRAARRALDRQSRLRYFGLHVYDIRLWSDSARAAAAPADTALALELVYARKLRGWKIAERSLEEMQGIAPIDASRAEAWLAWLNQVLPDVSEGDRITGVQRPAVSTRLFVNGRLAGELRDAEFTRLFFAVWLSDRSSQPRLREALLGGRGGAS